MHFADRLCAAVRARKTPAIVGLDPRADMLPQELQSTGPDPEKLARNYAAFCRGIIDVVAPLVPAVKPQAAFFEQCGAPGVAALAEVIAYARQADTIVILDAKRGDIGSTAEAYARGLLRNKEDPAATHSTESQATENRRLEIAPSRSLASDAVTVNPYLGGDALEPFVEVATQEDCGVFILVKTSNPGGGMFQDLVAGGLPVYRHVAAYVNELSMRTKGACGYGAVAAVVGATYPAQLAELRAAMPATWLLVPGYGSQGGGAKDVAAAFDERGLGAIINNSRGIIFAFRQAEYAHLGERRWQDAVEAATGDMIEALRLHTPAAKL